MKREIPEGCRVRYYHERPMQDVYAYSAKGGRTIARILDENENVLAEGECRCRSDENYVKSVGRAIALERALAELDGTIAFREDRRARKDFYQAMPYTDEAKGSSAGS